MNSWFLLSAVVAVLIVVAVVVVINSKKRYVKFVTDDIYTGINFLGFVCSKEKFRKLSYIPVVLI